ncbi:ribonuclease P/MRP protein subunit POP5-like [Tubulanus polymorphus]|uniref:ribonuclease P/MRP protein subunit POP5-like n=1 Tax=Tubulanus polymorphus TaxID=672921 RepID=UPI003DA23341
MVRLKNRYLLCEIIYENENSVSTSLTAFKILNCLKDAVLQIHGVYGGSLLKASISVKYFNEKTNIVLIRAARGSHKLLQSAMTFVQKIGDYSAFFNTIHIGGTIQSCQKFLMKYNKRQLKVLLALVSKKEERKKIRENIKQCSIVKQNPYLEENDEKMVSDND